MGEAATEATKIMQAIRIFEVSLSKRTEFQRRFVGDFWSSSARQWTNGSLIRRAEEVKWNLLSSKEHKDWRLSRLCLTLRSHYVSRAESCRGAGGP
jgi:hypothetical protein